MYELLRSVLRNAGARRVAVFAVGAGLGWLAAHGAPFDMIANGARAAVCAVGLSEVCE